MAFMTFTRDVCILGAGASGMSAAVFLKDKGYDVLVIEKDEHVGGHCESHYFTPPTPGQPNWVELGVQVFPDTALENATGIGSWTLSSRAFAQRFLPPASTIPYVSNIQNYGFDFIRNFYTGPLPNPPVTQDYIDTFIRFNTILATRYPWLENVHFPDPIPPELLQPFGTFIDANNLTAIDSFFYGLLYFGGMGPQRNVTTLYALQNLRRGINILYSAPEYGFAIKGGCSKIYNGIATFLNGKNVHVQSTIQRVERLKLGPREQDWISTIFYTRKGYPGLQVEKCRNLIVAFPQLLNQMNFIDIYPDERAIFKDVRANFYYRYGVNANGPITNGPYSVVSLDLVNANRIPPLPNILTIRREYTYGPSVGNAYAETDISNTTMYNLISDYMSRLSPNVLTNIKLFGFERHFYQAHFTDEALSRSPTPYTRLDQLQGKRNTYWTGALFSFAESATIWQKTKDLIDRNFPNKR